MRNIPPFALQMVTSQLHIPTGYAVAWKDALPPTSIVTRFTEICDDLEYAKQNPSVTIADMKV